MALTDPCGNPLPFSLTLPDFVPEIPSIPDLLKLLGIQLPQADFDVPCPILLDAARESSGV